MFGELVKRKGVMRNEASDKYRASRFTHHARQKGQAVLLATLIMFVVAAVGAGFILFVQSSMNLSQRAREEQEALLLAQAGLAFADAQLTEHGADWRPSIMVDFDEFEKAQGWARPDSENDWYGKYAARQVVDLLGNVPGSGSFLVKVKYKPYEQVFKIISIGRPRPNSPVFRRLVAYKPIPADWIWVTAENEGSPDPLLWQMPIDLDGDGSSDRNEWINLLGHAINWELTKVDLDGDNIPETSFLFNAERDPNNSFTVQMAEPYRISWLRLRTWLGSSRLPIWDSTLDRTVLAVFTSTIRINSDLLWYGTNALEVTSFFAAAQTVLEVARTISHYADNPVPVGGTQVLVYADDPTTQGDTFQGVSVPSAFGSPPGSGFLFFPVGGIPRYMDGWERIGGLMPVRWVFNFSRRVEPRPAPTIDLSRYYDQTRDADPPYSQNGYYRQPDPLRGQPPILDNNPNSPTFGFHVLNYFDSNNPLLAFRGIYIDNGTDRQFVTSPPADTSDVNGDSIPDPNIVFGDANGTYRPELAQVYDWTVKPPMLDPNNPTQLHPRRQQLDSGWLEDIDDDNDGLFSEDPVNSRDDDNDGRIDEDPDANYVTERNMVEVQLPFTYRTAAPNFYVPPGVEVRFDVVPSGIQNVVLQRTWLIRHDLVSFRRPDGTPLIDDPSTPINESVRLVFIDPVQLVSFDADNDGHAGEDPINFRDDDNDGRVDEDPLQTAPQNGQMPTIVILAEGNIRVSGQVAVAVKIVTPETIYIEGPLHPVTANATIELLAKRNICLNFAAARTPIPVDGLNPILDRATLLPRFKVSSLAGYVNLNDPLALQGADYLLPNAFSANLPIALFADLLGGSVNALAFPAPQDRDGNRVVDAMNGNNPLTAQVDFSLTGTNLTLSQDLQQNFQQLLNGVWTLRLVLLHRGMASVQDSNSPNGWQAVPNPWTNLAVYVCIDEDGDGNIDLPGDANHDGNPDDDGDGQVDEDSVTRIYVPAEPMRTFPVASRWYQGDGRQVVLNDDPTTMKEWGIMEIPIPPTTKGLFVDRDNDGQVTVWDLWSALQRLHVVVVSPVANEVIPQGRTLVRYELAGIKLALYDEHGIPRPIWQASSSWFVLAQTIHAENGTIGIVPPPYFDPTAHPSWQQLIASTDPNWQTRFRQWQRLWSFYYLRHNSVRWSAFIDPADPTLPLPNSLRMQLIAQSIPVLAGQLIMRVTPQTMLWRLAAQSAVPATDPFKAQKDNSLRFAWEIALDKAALPYANDLDPQNKLADLINLQRQIAPVFAEVPRTMFSPAWWRVATPQGVIVASPNFTLPPYFRAPVVPNLNLPKGYVMVLQQQVGKD